MKLFCTVMFLLSIFFLSTGCVASGSFNTLVIAVSGSFTGVFSPFNSTSGTDMDVLDLVHASLLRNDRNAQPESNLAEYQPPVEITDNFGKIIKTVYTFKLIDGVCFSNGSPITADDIIFSYYVHCDPSYAGHSTIYTTPIEGVMEYRNGTAATIRGIRRIDDRTVEITITGVDPKAIWNLGAVSIVSRHYYNDGKPLVRGDLSAINAKDSHPVGAGPFVFVKFDNKVVHLERNPFYFRGMPKIAKIKLQEVPQVTILDAVLRTDIDIGSPLATPESLQDAKDSGLHCELTDYLGYGYIGINASRVSDRNVRKGLMCLMNRTPAVRSYYGDLASIIERPMSKVSWAYPQNATEVYHFDPQRALAYFTAAGYVQSSVNDMTILQKDGRQLHLEIAIAGQGLMDHPAAPILTQMKKELEKIGGVLDIQDVDGTILLEKLDAKKWDLWVAAWGATIDPDMYQVYHSKGPSNHYCVANAELDSLVIAARSMLDQETRAKLYARCLDIVMEEAVEMPVYQRKNLEIYNPQMVNTKTLPDDVTVFYGYGSEIERLQMIQ